MTAHNDLRILRYFYSLNNNCSNLSMREFNMKKLTVLALLFSLTASAAFADGLQWTREDGPYTQTQPLVSMATVFIDRIHFYTDGTNEVTFQLWDADRTVPRTDAWVAVNPSGTASEGPASIPDGEEIGPTFTITTSSTDRQRVIEFGGVRLEEGAYIDILCDGDVEYSLFYLWESDSSR